MEISGAMAKILVLDHNSGVHAFQLSNVENAEMPDLHKSQKPVHFLGGTMIDHYDLALVVSGVHNGQSFVREYICLEEVRGSNCKLTLNN